MNVTIHHCARPMVILLAATLLLMTIQAYAQSAALVTDATGKAVVLSGTNQAPVAILAAISADARVRLDAGARVTVLQLQSGDEYILEGPALVGFAAREPVAISGNSPQKRAAAPTRTGDVRIARGAVTQAGFVMRNFRTTSRIKLLNLNDTLSLALNPEFRWESGEPDARYTFELFDSTGNSLYQTEVAATTLQPPASIQLRESTLYKWEVSARLPDGRRYVSYGKFTIAPADLRARVKASRPAPGAAVSDRVVFAVWLEQMGLRDEARRYWRALARERPGEATLQQLAGNDK